MLDDLFVPDPPAGDSSNRIADTRFVNNAIGSGIASTFTIAGLSVLGNASTASAGATAIVDSAANQLLVSNAANTTIIWSSISSFIDNAIGSTQGDILYRNSATWVALTPGTQSTFLQTQGAGANPQWAQQSRVLLNTLTINNQGSATDTTSLTSTYTLYEIVLENVIATTAAGTMRFRVHGGGTFKTTGYLASNDNVTSIPNAGQDGPTTFIGLSGGGSMGTTAPGISGRIYVSNPSTNAIHNCWGQFSHPQNSATSYLVITAGYWNTAGVIDGFSVDNSAGNINSGTIRVYGIQ